MKKYWILAAGLFIFACTQQKGFQITVNLEGAGGQVLLEQRGAEGWVPVDTADIADGVAVLEGIAEFPGDYYLSVVGQRQKALIFVENTKMTVTGKADSIYLAKVTGSATHDEYSVVNDQVTEISKKYMELYQQSRQAAAAGDTTKAEELMNQVEEMYKSISVLQTDFIKNNPASYVTPYFLSAVQYEKEVEELDLLVQSLDPKLQEIPSVVKLKEHIAKLKVVAVGQIAPDFTMNDPEGNPVKFSDVYAQNEYTLLDFWASWCGPCRQENPNVVAVYQEFKDKGFGVFGVSLDRDREAWMKAVQDDQLTWQHVSDLAYWQNAAAQLYAVNSIPSSLIVDRTGKIVAKNKRGDELRSTITELLK